MREHDRGSEASRRLAAGASPAHPTGLPRLGTLPAVARRQLPAPSRRGSSARPASAQPAPRLSQNGPRPAGGRAGRRRHAAGQRPSAHVPWWPLLWTTLVSNPGSATDSTTRFDPMLRALRPRHQLLVASLRRLLCTPSSSGTGKSDLPVDAAAMAAATTKAREEAAARARAQAYKQVQNFDWSSGADWKTAANILFTVPPKRKEFGLDFHLVQLFFACMPSLAVYLVAQYARREIKRMEGEAEEKRKKDEELEKQKQLEEESAKEDADSKLSKVLDRLDTLEVVVKEIVDDKRKLSSPDLPTKEEVAKKDKASPGEASDSKNDSQPVTVKSKDISCAANAPANTAKPNIKGICDKALPVESES